MKFILNEGKKFILEERFILKESNILTEDKTSAEKLLLAVNNLERWVPSILEALQKAQALELDDILKALCTDILKILEEANLKYLIAELKENAALYQADKIGKERHNGILGLVGDRLTGDFQSVVTTIDNIQKSASPANYNLEKLQQKLNDIKTHISELQKWMEENNNKIDNNDIEIATEWAELYKLCGNTSDKQKAFKAFWNGGLPLKNEANPDNLPIAADAKFKLGYYKGEWGEQGELIRSFGSHFTKLLSEHGWTATLNPFISFLKYLFTLKNITINDASFAHIVEAFNSGLISIKDLRGKGILEKFNLIFNPSLYTDSTSIIEYLKGQSTAIKWANNLPANSNLKTVFMNIAAKDGNSSNLNDSKILGAITANSYNYTIRPLTAYKELIKTTFDPDDEENEIVKDATDSQISSIVSSINTQDKAKKFLAYLISVCRIMDDNLADKINKKFNNKLISNRNTTQTTFEDEVAFDKILNRSTTKYSTKQLEEIITEVIKIAKI